MEPSDADKIWNRAALDSGGESPLEGDLYLSRLLYFHGMAMNGGLSHAFDVLSEDEIDVAIKGFTFFGFDELAGFLDQARVMEEAMQDHLSSRYYEAAPDSRLFDAFITVLTTDPEFFAPVKS